MALALGNGQGLTRLLQFSGNLSNENKTVSRGVVLFMSSCVDRIFHWLQKLQLSWWNDLIKEYFTPKAVMKFTLWKDNQRNEAKPFGSSSILCLHFRSDLLNVHRNRRANTTTIFSCNNTIWCQIHDTDAGRRAGAHVCARTRDRGMCHCGMDLQIH